MMSDCNRVAPLFDVYADDQASAETNALVMAHVDACESCASELRRIVLVKALLRETLRGERASSGLRTRVLAQLETPRQATIGVRLRRWLAPAAAAALVVLLVAPRQTDASAQVKSAVAEHVICALNGHAVPMLDAVAAERGYARSMPWVRSVTGVRIVDAHTCGQEHFAHLILEDRGSRASILVASRTAAASARPLDVVRDGRFDVDVLTTATHVAYLVVERGAVAGQRAWRKAAMERVAQFLHQVEGP